MPLRRKTPKQESVETTVPETVGLKPSLDYLHGYTVTETKENSVTFENAAAIVSDRTIKNSGGLIGLCLISNIYSKDGTRLMFGRVVTKGGVTEVVDKQWVELKPAGYTISDPRFLSLASYRPNASEEK